MCRTHGGPGAVRVEELPGPRPSAGEVTVRVGAAAVNYPDVLLVADRYQRSVTPPFVVGSEFAGTVSEIGSATAGVAVGDRVMGTVLCGAFAEEVVVAPAALTPIPEGIDVAVAAAFGVAHRTAYHALRSAADVAAGQDVVVLGAGGGVGLAAVELAAHLGATVTAVASSPGKLAAAAGRGARQLVDHRGAPLREALRAALPGGASAVVDPVGGELSEPALRSLRRGGRFVTVGFASGVVPRIPLNLILVKGVTLHGFQIGDVPAGELARHDRELIGLLASGRIRPHIGAVFPLAETGSALQMVADGRAVGKVVIDLR